MTDKPLFELHNLSKNYNGRQVLSLDYLDIQPNQVVAMLGANGAGKSTLLHILALLLAPDGGKILFQGGNPYDSGTNRTQLRRRITLVAQDPYFFHATVLANVAYGLRLRGRPRRARLRTAEEALEKVGLAGFARRKVRTLSGGEAQRVALARSLVLEPQALLLDEPFANLDRESAAVFERIVRDTAQKGCAVVMVIHDHEQAMRLSDRVFHLKAGRLQDLPWSELN